MTLRVRSYAGRCCSRLTVRIESKIYPDEMNRLMKMILLFCLVLLKDYVVVSISTNVTTAGFVSHHAHHDNDTDWIINLPEAFEKGQLLDNQIIDTRSYSYTEMNITE